MVLKVCVADGVSAFYNNNTGKNYDYCVCRGYLSFVYEHSENNTVKNFKLVYDNSNVETPTIFESDLSIEIIELGRSPYNRKYKITLPDNIYAGNYKFMFERHVNGNISVHSMDVCVLPSVLKHMCDNMDDETQQLNLIKYILRILNEFNGVYYTNAKSNRILNVEHYLLQMIKYFIAHTDINIDDEMNTDEIITSQKLLQCIGFVIITQPNGKNIYVYSIDKNLDSISYVYYLQSHNSVPTAPTENFLKYINNSHCVQIITVTTSHVIISIDLQSIFATDIMSNGNLMKLIIVKKNKESKKANNFFYFGGQKLFYKTQST